MAGNVCSVHTGRPICQNDQIGRSVFSGVKIGAIGEATDGALRERGLRADFVPRVFTSEALVEELEQNGEILGQSFLLLRADIAPPALRLRLQEFGARVSEISAYRTVIPEGAGKELADCFRHHKIDYVLFTSSSTVQSFFQSLPKERKRRLKTRFISIGPVTTKTLKEFGYRPFREAKQHTISGLVEVLTHGEKTFSRK